MGRFIFLGVVIGLVLCRGAFACDCEDKFDEVLEFLLIYEDHMIAIAQGNLNINNRGLEIRAETERITYYLAVILGFLCLFLGFVLWEDVIGGRRWNLGIRSDLDSGSRGSL